MNVPKFLKLAIAGSLISLLAACGSGDDDVASDADAQSSFISAYTSGLDTLGSYAGLVSSKFRDLFDAGYTDSGMTKADVVAALDSEITVSQTSPDFVFPAFPMAKLSKASIGNCDAVTKICTLTGTLSNSDADPTGADASAVTEVNFTTQVRQDADGKVRLLGDQSKS
jgi:hypothetical protein